MKTAFYDGITEFIFVENQPQKADVIFLPGGAYPEAALYAAILDRLTSFCIVYKSNAARKR